MSDPDFEPWSNNPYAPMITQFQYFLEKTWFTGNLLTSILYGMLVVLFFKCMTALLGSAHRRGEGIKWGLVSYTVITFSLATMYTGSILDELSISYIDNRNFPDGPYRYLIYTNLSAVGFIPRTAFRLGNWLADGLLLYRCYIIYSANPWVIAFPCLMYLASVVMGIMSLLLPLLYSCTTAYISLSLSVNVLLTLMIVVRLFLHRRNVRAATGSPAGTGGLYKSIATMLIESSALFAVSSVLTIVPWAIVHPIANLFNAILPETQAIASLLIIQRVANRSAFASDTIASGNRGQGGSGGGSDALPGGHSIRFMSQHRTSVSEGGVGVGTVDDIRLDKV